MRDIEKLEARERLEAEVARGVLYIRPEKAFLLQKHAQAEEIQSDKHDRLRRALQSSGVEELRLSSARHNGTIGRLAARLRDQNRRRKVELRGKLAALRGVVAREWRAHNTRGRGDRVCSGGGRGIKSGLSLWRDADERADAGQETWVAAGSGKVSRPDQRQDAAALEGKHSTCDPVVSEAEAVPGAESGSRKGVGTRSPAGPAVVGGMPSEGGVASSSLPLDRELDKRENGTSCEIPRRPLTPIPNSNKQKVDGESLTVFAYRSDCRGNAKEGARAEVTASNSLSTPITTLSGPASKKILKTTGGEGGPLQRRRKRVASAAKMTSTTAKGVDRQHGIDSATSGAFAVLSEEEARALAAFGRGAPTDPRLLLLATPPAPPSRWGQEEEEGEEEEQQRQHQQHRQQPQDVSSLCAIKNYFRDEGGEFKEDANVEGSLKIGGGNGGGGVGAHGGGMTVTCAAGRKVGGELDIVLERAVDKLAREIQAEEEISRRRFGMGPG
ncbi:unnamed protein product [Hapterophycus canaliculatus]